MKLMIVESPNKVKKISSILGSGWKVAASVGHVRDLPEDEAGVAAPDYQPKYQLTVRGRDVIAKLKPLVAEAEAVYLATDPDREGEAIAWHLEQSLRIKNAKRVTFDSITEAAIREALKNTRNLDMQLVRAQEARRVLDRLVGFQISPVLAALIKDRASAGRVQSPAVRLVVERERAISGFRETTHYQAQLSFSGGQWAALWNTKQFLKEDEKYILDEDLARKAASVRALEVRKSDRKDQAKSPPPAFTTSTLLQAASAQLRYKPNQTAKLSQSLFEQGLITYHRTDSQNLSDEAIAEIRAYAQGIGLPLPSAPRKWGSKQDAQEAHEAIRPTHIDVETAGETPQEQALYDMIRKRALASQLADAIYTVTALHLEGPHEGTSFLFTARSSVLKERGWKSLTAKDATDEEDESEEVCGNVPLHPVGTKLTADEGKVLTKTTEPPSRYSQAGLIKKLEALGIGRPSTYASIITNIMYREYIEDRKNQLHPTDKAYKAIDALTGAFEFVEYEFTRQFEVFLDDVAKGKSNYHEVVERADRQLQSELGRTGVDLSQLTAPTTPQLNFARKLAEQLNAEIPREALEDRKKLADWLTGAKKKADLARASKMQEEPASDAQKGVIQRAIDSGKMQAPDGWPEIDKLSASKLIDKLMGGKKKAPNGKRRQ